MEVVVVVAVRVLPGGGGTAPDACGRGPHLAFRDEPSDVKGEPRPRQPRRGAQVASGCRVGLRPSGRYWRWSANNGACGRGWGVSLLRTRVYGRRWERQR